MGVLRRHGARLYFHATGKGEALVLLHGIGGSGRDWEHQIPAFARHFRVIAPDLRGYGASDRAGEFSVETFAADVWALLDHLRVRQAHVLGYSMGGAVAMQMALERPKSVGRLVLSNTLPSFETDTPAKRALLWTRLLLMGLVGPEGLARVVARRLYPGPDQAALREEVARRNATNSRWVYIATVRNLVRWSVRPRLARLKMPVLVLAAEQDYFPRADAERFAAALPHAELRVFPGTRHGLPRESPGPFNEAVLGFLLPGRPPEPRAASAPLPARGS
jgi:3-oxoadipate enol-lactonase